MSLLLYTGRASRHEVYNSDSHKARVVCSQPPEHKKIMAPTQPWILPLEKENMLLKSGHYPVMSLHVVLYHTVYVVYYVP